MAKKASELVAANVDRLMRKAGLSNAALEKKSGGRLKRSTVDRVRRAQGSAGVDSIAEIARALGFDLWQVCVRDLVPERPPSLLEQATGDATGLSTAERELLVKFRSLSPPFQRLVLNDLERYLQAELQTEEKKGEHTKRHA
ncbi:helix-turn-helix domain-containing protein [Bordetella genomosp. 11]|uniref:Uncharacterized protein n=1 Tax=Bordetella genomosp. 11 TaxID=1416808 RepID=A0A261ULA4_9BORD|nr:hypothetical protein [Bordetella genomosp. 11]OZI62152.1 hypothetical protein CAL28_23315 [Bordetella genomosp. 11]